jgi:aryl-alcohol dehydrogenase-like predicted oxidoreductase
MTPTGAPLPRFVPRRELGRTGFVAARLGIGDVADRHVPLEQCVATVRRAMDAGLNVIDTAPGYEDGYSEEILRHALRGRRDGMFVIDKIDHADQPVGPQADKSLAALGLERVDLFVFHGVSVPHVWERLSGPGGGMEELAAAVRAGKVAWRGISSHCPQVVRAAILSGLCDVVMFPIGPFCDLRYLDVLVLARQRDVGTVCFKTFAAGKLLGDTEGYNRPLALRPRGKSSTGGDDWPGMPVLPFLTVQECVSYTLTCDPDVALLGLSFPNEQDAALAAAARFTSPLTLEQMADIRTRAAQAVEGKGACWWNPPVA